MNRALGVIGGSGLYHVPGLEQVRRHEIATPYGAPSDAVVEGRLGADAVFVADNVLAKCPSKFEAKAAEQAAF